MNYSYLKKYFPPLDWIKIYDSKTLLADSISGMTLAAYAIPVSLAYATLAGLPPQYGVYGYLIGGIFYALLGTGRQLAVGPTSAISLIIGVSLSSQANGDVQRWVDLASLTAMMLAGMSLLAYVLRLNSIINFISETVLLGFKAGAAIAIALTQLPKLFGVSGGGSTSAERFITLFRQLPDTNGIVLLFGLSSILLIYYGERLFPGKPVKITVVAIAILVVSYTGIGQLGFKTVGVIPPGLPSLHFPSFHMEDVQLILPLAFACFLLAYIESVSAARTLAQQHNYEIDPHQELLALGVSNLATSLGHGYPVSGGLSQSVINEKAGAKTPVSLVVASLTIALCLLFLTGLLKNLPVVILASVVLVAIRGLVDLKEFIRLFKVNRFDFLIACIALAGVIAFGILEGVVLSALVSLLLLIRIVSTPHIAFLGRIHGTNRYTDLKRHPDNETFPHVLLFRVEAPLFYFNTGYVFQTIWKRITAKGSKLKVVIFDLSTSAYVDSSGARMIKRLYLDLEARGITLKIADAHTEVRDILRFENIEHLMGHISRRDSVHSVVLNTISEHETRHGKIKYRIRKKKNHKKKHD